MTTEVRTAQRNGHRKEKIVPDNTHPRAFPWHDEGVVKRTPPLALAARMACLIGGLEANATESNNSEAVGIWIVDGIAAVIEALEKTGQLDAISTLLTGLEGQVSPDYRARWPLAGQIAAEHPVVVPPQEAEAS